MAFFSYSLTAAHDQNNKPYLHLILADKTGQVEGRAQSWPTRASLKNLNRGDIIKIRGCISRFDDRLQLSARSTPPRPSRKRPTRPTCCPAPLRRHRTLATASVGFAESLSNPHLKLLLTTLLNDPALSAAYQERARRKVNCTMLIGMGGLLEHVVSLWHTRRPRGAPLPVPRSAQIWCSPASSCTTSGKSASSVGTSASKYTVEGVLLGHIHIGGSLSRAEP